MSLLKFVFGFIVNTIAWMLAGAAIIVLAPLFACVGCKFRLDSVEGVPLAPDVPDEHARAQMDGDEILRRLQQENE